LSNGLRGIRGQNRKGLLFPANIPTARDVGPVTVVPSRRHDEAVTIEQKPLGRIVVGVDGSPGSHAALGWAIAEAQMRKVPLHAVMCWPGDSGARAGGLPTRLSDPDPAGLRAFLDETTAVAGGAPIIMTGSVVRGNPAQVLAAAAMGADLLVVGCRGHGRVVGTLLGSVSQLLVTLAPCAVIVVPDAQQLRQRRAAVTSQGNRQDGSGLPTQADSWTAMRAGT
jgi:nucleotide-binding universal stress UspA family protein